MAKNFDTKESSKLKQSLEQLVLKSKNKPNNFDQNELLLVINNFDVNDLIANTQLLNKIITMLNDAYFKLANPLMDDGIYDKIEKILVSYNFDIKNLKLTC